VNETLALTDEHVGKNRKRRDCRPTLEAIEALRLLSCASAGAPLPGIAAEHGRQADPTSAVLTRVDDTFPVSNTGREAAIAQTRPAGILSGVRATAARLASTTASTCDSAAMFSGLAQLDKYLGRAWYRAGIPLQVHEDSSQAVFTRLLQQLGRHRFDVLVRDVGLLGIKDVFSRKTNAGVDFFRAVDMVKKRAQRERLFQALDGVDIPEPSWASESRARHEALREAIDRSLSRREASLINDTLMGKTPAEISLHWGVTPKTISNQKTRAMQKLRDVLLSEEPD
jgi:DNA-binding CsgD family transcriptional regulator